MATKNKSNILCSNESNQKSPTETLFDSIKENKGATTILALIQEGADINARDSNGTTPLLLCSLFGREIVFSLLIDSGAKVDNIEYYCNKSTLLHNASRHGWTNVVQSLVKRVPISASIVHSDCSVSCEESIYPTIHARNTKGKTALNIGSSYGHLEVVKCLVEGGADINARCKEDKTVLYEASLFGHLDIVKYLLEKGADMNVKNCWGVSPLLVAACFCHKNIVHLLLSSGATSDGCDEDKCTVLHYAARRGWTQIVQSLVKRECDLNARDIGGDTALLYASRNKQVPVVKCLLKAGAIWDIKDTYGDTPLNFLSLKSCASVKVMKSFIEGGAYLMPVDYLGRFHRLKRTVLRDVNFCCQTIINKFNAHDLPALYELPVSARLPRIEKMIIPSGSKVAQTIKQTVKLVIKTHGYCDVLAVRPMSLSLFSVRSVLKYYNKTLKRQATFDSKNECQHLSKSMRLS